MGSDRARLSYDPKQQYRAVVGQQGRVTVEADWNEAQTIVDEEIRQDALDFVGPSGTPDDGYAIGQALKVVAPDFSVSHGTMYVGGVRVELEPGITYSSQQEHEWLDHQGDPDWVDLAKVPTKGQELVYLSLREQEVSAVEDSDLLEVALGGPDTAARLRLIQRIARLATNAKDCPGALVDAQAKWETEGLFLDPATLRLHSQATLQAKFKDPGGPANLCEPTAHGGYLGADNQLIRVQVAAQDQVLWGFDNTSFLYRVDVIDDTTLHLQAQPVDAAHHPRSGQTVEVLRSAVHLNNGEYVASATGFVTSLAGAYDPDTQQITLAQPLTGDYHGLTEPPPVFLRVWEERLPFTAGQWLLLGQQGQTGLQVILDSSGGKPFHVGDYWLIAVRPGTPTEVYPKRYLETPQRPDGPRLWACSLAVIGWQDGAFQFLDDCRNHFDNLVDLSKRKTGGCCTVSVRPEDLTGDTTLASILAKFVGQEPVTLCLMPGTYSLKEPLRLGREHSNLTIEGCHDGVIIQAAQGTEKAFLDGLIVLNHANSVTLRGLRFELPLAPFADTGGKLANLQTSSLNGLLGSPPKGLYVSIAVRPLHCANLTIEGCQFRFALDFQPRKTDLLHVFGVGVFAGSECWGVTLKDNRFGREEDYLRSVPPRSVSPRSVSPRFRFLAGYLLAPSVVNSIQTRSTAASAARGGALVRPLLQAATFQNNVFAGLTIGALIDADSGAVKFADNTVRDCFAGFWLLSLRSVALAEFIRRIEGVGEAASSVGRFQSSIRMLAQNSPVWLGGEFARLYPLPSEFDVVRAIGSESVDKGAPSVADSVLIQRLVANAVLLFESPAQASAAAATPAVEVFQAAAKVEQSPGGAAPLPSTAEAAPPASGAEAAPPAPAPPPTLPEALVSTPAAVAPAPVARALRVPAVQLSAFERAALSGAMQRRGVQLGLHLEGNNLDARVSNVTSGIALLVWDDDGDTLSDLTMGGNQVRTRAPSLPAALIVQVQRCAITGNLILNEERAETAALSSLDLFPGAGAVAVTGNVFRGTPRLPSRPAFTSVPSPMNTWIFLNTVI